MYGRPHQASTNATTGSIRLRQSSHTPCNNRCIRLATTVAIVIQFLLQQSSNRHRNGYPLTASLTVRPLPHPLSDCHDTKGPFSAAPTIPKPSDTPFQRTRTASSHSTAAKEKGSVPLFKYSHIAIFYPAAPTVAGSGNAPDTIQPRIRCTIP